MRQGNGSDLLGLKDSRSTKIGLIYVAPNDDRKSVLAAILTQEKLGRKQIAVVLPEQQPNKAFHRSQDFDDLKAIRRKLRAQLIFIAPAGPGPAEFARQRRFSVYSSLGSYADALGAESSLAETRQSLGKLITPSAENTADPPSHEEDLALPLIATETHRADKDWDAALSPIVSTSSSPASGTASEAMLPFTHSSRADTPDPAEAAHSISSNDLPTSAEDTPVPIRDLHAVPSSAHAIAQDVSIEEKAASPDKDNSPIMLYRTTSNRSAGFIPFGRAIAKRPAARGLLLAALIMAILLICGSISNRTSGQFFGLGLLANGDTAPATITITPKSKFEQDSYIIQAVTGNADPAKRQIALRQLTFSPPQQSKSVTATGIGQIGAERASGMLVFSNGSGTDFPLQAGTTIHNANGIAVTTDQYIDIPAGNPLSKYVATVSVTAHAANAGVNGNIGALTIDELCCTSGNAVGVKNPDAFSGGKDAKDYKYLQQSDVDALVHQLKPMLSQQAQDDLKSQIKPNEQLAEKPQCTTQPNADQPIGDQGQNVTTANVTINAACTVLTYDTDSAQKIAQSLLTKKASSDLGTNYVLKGTIITKQEVTDVQDNVVTLQLAVAGNWYYQFSDNQEQNIAKQLASKSRTAAQNMLDHYRGIAKAKIEIANGDTLPDNAQETSIIVLAVSAASPVDLPALPTIALTSLLVSTGGRG